jgi:hypothetical protein
MTHAARGDDDVGGYEPIDAIRVVEARCLRGRCQEQETVMHVTWRHAPSLLR